MMKYLYPNTGYDRNPYGKPSNLRKLTTLEKIKKFHKTFYRPENMVIKITGKIELKNLFTKLKGTEDTILKKRLGSPMTPFTNPWIKPLKKLNLQKDMIKKKIFSSKNESTGEI